ncbi:sulfotransferase family protein [Olleya sp. R77988]|uniref:sulfotransferase-like domain-containing protein n=1 Tax=Olleya sp. R77988 TaxID=3093875 RepID=UPI0037C64A62
MIPNNIKRICLWSGPRNISTALMYSFAQREDTKVFDEPLYAYYLANSKAKEYHPGADDILKSQKNNGSDVVATMLNDQSSPILFFKQMTHHFLDGLDKGFLKQTINIILTRDPKDMIPSFAKVIEKPTIDDIGYAKHVELLNYLKSTDNPPIVLDSKSVLLNPEKTLRKLCLAIGIPFNLNMLKWKAGSRPEDGVWAKYWYSNVHKSTSFGAYKPKTDPFPESLIPLLEKCLPYYNQLLQYNIG